MSLRSCSFLSALCLSALLFVTAAGAAEDWHCLVGVGGAFASGYAGILARYGIPYEVLLDHQLAEAETLRKYDLLLICGLFHPNYIDVAEALDAYVREGGNVVFEEGRPRPGLWRRWGSSSEAFLIKYFDATQFIRPSVASIRIAGGYLAPEVSSDAAFDNLRVASQVVADVPGAQVWATYSTVKEMRPDMPLAKRARLSLLSLKEGDPAAVVIPRGKGRYLIWGPALGASIALGAAKMDNLVLSMTRVLTNGRAVPQLTADGVSLGRKQSKRSLKLESEQEEEFRVAPPLEPTRISRAELGSRGPGNRTPLPPGVEELSQDDDPEFNVSGLYSPSSGPAAILFNYWNESNYWSLELGRDAARLVTVRKRRRSIVASVPFPQQSESVPFVLQERAQVIALYLHDAGRVTHEVSSLWNGRVGFRGSSLTQVRYQPVTAVYFADDFMRSEGETGEWKTVAGQWKLSPVQNPDMGANPFAFHAEAQPTALAETGRDYWDTYRFRASVRPDSSSGQVGLIAYRRSDRDYLMFRARIADAPRSIDNGFELVRVLDGKEIVLAKTAGSLVEGQTYELAIKVLDKWVGAFVDGEKVLVAVDASLPGGRIALWCDNAKVKFDDVVVEPSNVREGIGKVFGRGLPSYAGVIDQDTWAGPAMQWRADPTTRGLFWNQGPFYGDVGLRLKAEAVAKPGGRVTLVINSKPLHAKEGYAFVATREEDRLVLDLTRNGKSVSHNTQLYTGTSVPVMAIRRAGNTIYGRINNRTALAFTDAEPLTASRGVAFRSEGVSPRIADVAYWTANVLDYTFETAPTDWWVGSGAWDVTNRWSCTPDWSWFGGTSPHTDSGDYKGKAVIWNKRRIEGDVAIDFFTGPKMLPVSEGPRRAKEKMQDFNATLCGDGVNALSGYAFVLGPGGSNKAQILREGKVVAENTQFLMPRLGHNRWINARAEKIGGALSLYFDGQLLLRYEDPQTLTGGYAALWTDNNGILIPRVSLYYEKMSGPSLANRARFESLRQRETTAPSTAAAPSSGRLATKT